MEEKKYLNEETFQKNKKKLIKLAVIVLVVGILLGGTLIVVGVVKQNKLSTNETAENKVNLQEKVDIERQKLEEKKKELEQEKTELENKRVQDLADEKQKLETKKKELEDKGIKYNASANYDAGETYDLKVITNVLDPSFNYCNFDEYENNSVTSKYCSLLNNKVKDSEDLIIVNEVLNSSVLFCNLDKYKNNSITSTYCSYLTDKKLDYDDIENSFETGSNKISNLFGSTVCYMIGGFIILASCMIAGSIYMFAKRREIVAFSAQQVVPVGKEVVDTMAPTMGNAAKEIAKGIKQGINEADAEKENNKE